MNCPQMLTILELSHNEGINVFFNVQLTHGDS